MKIEPFFDEITSTLTYVVYDPASRDAVVIDPVLDFDPLSSTTATKSLDRVASFLEKEGLRVHYALETHAHADHLSGGQYLKRRFHARTGIGARIRDVQEVFKGILGLAPSFAVDGSQFDRLFEGGETTTAGTLVIEVIATPGHTPACVTYKIGDAVFTGDALFVEDYGTGRCDFPSGSADALYTSVHERLYALPDATRVFVGHDYRPDGRPLRYETTIGKSKEANVHLRACTTREAFVETRVARDAILAAPRLLYASVQINIDAGRLPSPHENGHRYLTVPLNPTRKTADDGSAVGTRSTPVTLIDASARRSPDGYRDVLPTTLAADLSSVRVVDVREAHETRGELGHIRGAELVPLATVEAAARRWPKDEALVFVCRSGARSGRAAAALTASGFLRVMNMVGGMLAWNEAGLPVERVRE